MQSVSPIAKRAKKRSRLVAARKRAPKHPKGPEARIRIAVSKMLTKFHAHIRDTVMHYAPHYLERKQGADSHAKSDVQTIMLKSKKDPKPTKAHDAIMAGVFTALWSHGRHLLIHSPFQDTLKKNAAQTAESAQRQVAKALGKDSIDVDLGGEANVLSNNIYDDIHDRISDSVQRAEDIFDEWSDLDPDTSPRAGDTDALGDMLETGLSGVLGSALAYASQQFSWSWGGMNQEAQTQSGVAEYTWVAQNDSVVRPEHRALDGQECTWDDPPLSADDSSSGDECHPGEDYNCRCIASPIPPDDQELN